MRQSNNGRRSRGGRPTRRPGPLKSQTFDSNGPEVRIRGNAHQVLEKYQNLARDAHTNGDRVLAESYYQFAEHYYRIVHESTDPESPGSQRSHQREDRDEGGRNESEDNESEPRSEQSGNRRRSDRSQPRQPAEAQDAEQPKQEEAAPAAPPVNGETADSDREGLERALGSKTLVLSDDKAAKEEGKEEGNAEGKEGEPASEAGEEEKSSRGNGSRSTRSRSRYRRSSTRSKETEESAPQRRQFPMPADAKEQAEEGESQES